MKRVSPFGRSGIWASILLSFALVGSSCADRSFDNPVDTNVQLDAPAITTVIAQADTAVLIAWTYSGKAISGFQIERQVGSGSWTTVASTNASARQLIDQVALIAGQSYKYQMRALSSSNQSAYATSTPLSILFTDPTNVILTAQADTAVVVGWTYSGTLQTGFEVDRQLGTGSWTGVGNTNASARQLIDRVALVAGQTYRYQVRALSSSNQSAYASSAPLSITFTDPTNVTLTAQADTVVVAAWAYSGALQTGFEVERQVGTGSWTGVGTTNSAARQLIDRVALVAGQTYRYQVRALGSNNQSAYVTSMPLSIVFTDPTNVTLTAQADTAVVLGWNYTGAFQTGFEVERQIGAGSWTGIGTGNSSSRGYRDDLALSDGQTYAYRIRAVSRNNQSQFGSCTPFFASLGAPSNVTITALSSSSVSLSWQDNSSIEYAFGIEESTDGLNFVWIGTSPTGTSIGTFATTHVSGQNYWFRVRAMGRFANGVYSSVTPPRAIPPGMIFVTGGTFQMGSTRGPYSEQPIHPVTLSSFWLDATEVTVAQYRTFCTATGRSMPLVPAWGWSDDNPIVNVNWNDATAYAQWAGKRLPTEAEWEYAGRGGNKTNGYTYGGGNTIGDVAWYAGNSGNRTRVVGTKTPNELGLFDMSGNVQEWCSDWYDETYYSRSPTVNPKGPSSGIARVLRSSAWSSAELGCVITSRRGVEPSIIYDFFGLRCAADY